MYAIRQSNTHTPQFHRPFTVGFKFRCILMIVVSRILSLSFLTSLLYTNTPKRKRSKIEEENKNLKKTKALHSTIHTNPRINREKNMTNTHRRYTDEWRRAQKSGSKRWICWAADFQKTIRIFIYNRKIKIFAHKHFKLPRFGTANYLFCSFYFSLLIWSLFVHFISFFFAFFNLIQSS